MSHYFETPTTAATPHQVHATIWGRDYAFSSSAGVFSASRLDPGTAVLFRLADPPEDRPARFLDLGCGFGPIAAALATSCPQARVDAVDVNQRALDLTAANAASLGLADRVSVFQPDDVPPETQYDEIWSNPPIRIGKPALHELLSRWLARLAPDGRAVMVVSRNLGADSLAAWLESQTWAVQRLGSSQGFRVLCVTLRSFQTLVSTR